MQRSRTTRKYSRKMQEVKMEVDESIVKEENVDALEGMSYEEKLELVNPIAKPMAPKKLTKKIYKCIKKGKLFQLFLVFFGI